MAFLTQLDVVNQMLATLGEAPLNQITDDHPLVPAAIRELRITSGREQAKGWWFNTEYINLTPDVATGFLYVPGDCLSVNPFNTTTVVQRGGRMYNLQTASYTFTDGLPCQLIRQVDFEDLPVSASAYIGLSAVLKFQTDYDADGQKTRQLMMDLAAAYTEFNSEHIRAMKVNLLNRPTTAAALNRLGGNPQLGGIRN